MLHSVLYQNNKRLLQSNPDVATGGSYFKFPGRGQRDTPVTDARGIVNIILLLPGTKARAFRQQCADVLVRFLGGDESLLAEIKANRADAENDPQGQAAFFQAHVPETDDNKNLSFNQRQVALDERRVGIRRMEQEIRERDIRMEQDLRDRDIDFLVKVRNNLSSFGLENDPRIFAMLADNLSNILSAASTTPGLPVIDGAPTTMPMTISAYLKQKYALQHDVDARVSSYVGRKVASLYKNKHGAPNENKTIKFVNGESREIKVYTSEDFGLIDEAIADAIARGVFCERTHKYIKH